MNQYKNLKRIALLVFMLLAYHYSNAQTVIKGVIRDAATQKPLPFVSVYFKNHKGTVSDEDGRYTLSTTNAALTTIEFSCGGYIVISQTVVAGKEQEINVDMQLTTMKEVVVSTNKRGKYKNKDNPAVELKNHTVLFEVQRLSMGT